MSEIELNTHRQKSRVPQSNDVSVIIPSRLQRNTAALRTQLWLDRALSRIQKQTVAPVEVIVGLDPGKLVAVEPRFLEQGPIPVRFVEAAAPGQAPAVNAAARQATGGWLAFLEDDDYWEPTWLATALELGKRFEYQFISSNQRECDQLGAFQRYNDFATPSGWVMRSDVWRRLGGMDETFRYHVDTEFLGKCNAAGIRRCHVVEQGALDLKTTDDDNPANNEQRRRRIWLSNVSDHAALIESKEREPLVRRTVGHPSSGMTQIATNQEAAMQSQREHAEMAKRFGEFPW